MDNHPLNRQPNALVCALLSAGLFLSAGALAAEATTSPAEALNQWAKMVIYAITPYCQFLNNGLRVCQPIGLVGPPPNAAGAAPQSLLPVPLAPPSVQTPGMPIYGLLPFGTPSIPAAPPASSLPGMTPHHTPAPQSAAALPHAQEPTALPSIVPPAAPATEAAATTLTPQPASEPAAKAVEAPAPPTATPLAKVDTVASHAIPPAAAPSQPASASQPAVESPAKAGKAPAAARTTEGVTAAVSPAAPIGKAAGATLAHFEFDRAELTAAGKAALDVWLARHAKGRRVMVTGHADRLGPATYNLDLSRRRAEAVRDYLVSKGVAPSAITIVAKGETLPVKHCKGGLSPATIACLAPNRRVVVDP